MGFSMKGPSMSISYGGETNKQQKSNLMKDNPVAKHASAMHMGKDHSPVKAYGSKKSPMHQAKPDYIDIDGDGDTSEPMKAAAKQKSSPANLVDPKKKAKIASVEQTPKGNTKGLKKKKTIKPKPKAKTSHHMYGEMRDKKTGKIVKTFGTKPGSPASLIDPKKGKKKGKMKKEGKLKAGKMKKEGKLKATMTKKMTKIPKKKA
jgi:hypothetical protein